MSHAVFAGTNGVRGGEIPKRLFGQTGEMLSVIGPGGARFRMVSWEEATAIVRRCYELGINYYDNSHNYWSGRSEEVYGAVLSPVRSEVFITTKCDARTRKGAEQELDAGLKSMKTDYVDLWQLHKVGIKEDDLEAIFAPGRGNGGACRRQEIRQVPVHRLYGPRRSPCRPQNA